ncbi:MAG: Hsp33 family molecular chaperone HslO [Limnochordales bacterium]|nr:Hsp33 family molecular chaperone HslO [Limnochordales bacterium]
MRDSLIHAMVADGRLMAVAASTRETVEEAKRRHDTWPTATAALGRTLTGAVLLAAVLKSPGQRVMLQVAGDGPLGLVVAEATIAAAGVLARGYVQNPHTDPLRTRRGKLDVAAAVGRGTLWVIKDLGLREPYRGSVPLVSGEIAEDLAYYLVRSEQTPSLVALGVLVEPDGGVRAAGGIMVQVLPGADEATINELEQRARNMPPVSSQLEHGRGPEEILHGLLGDFGVQVLASRSVGFSCSCSRERLADALRALGTETLAELEREDGQAEVVCRFCGEKYLFSREDLMRLMAYRGEKPE